MSYNRGKNWNKKKRKLKINFQDLVNVVDEKYNSNFDTCRPEISKIVKCTPLHNLDSQLKEEIQNQLNKVPIYSGECHLTSWMFSGMSSKINSVKGWGVSEFRSFEDFLNRKSKSGFAEFKIKSFETMSDGWIRGIMENQTFWYDTNTNRHFFKHSWNEINGIHFDVQLHCRDEFCKMVKPEEHVSENNYCIPVHYTSTSELFDKEKEYGFPPKGIGNGKGLLEWCWYYLIKERLDQCEQHMSMGTLELYTFNRFRLKDEKIQFSPHFENRIKISHNHITN